jgi:Tat protein secretion system quality control protein TatD with DNase activity
VRLVAERVAELRGAPIEHVIAETAANAAQCFGDRVAATHLTD